jgi:mxaJ protein
MSSRCPDIACALAAAVLFAMGGETAARDIVVCADPDFLPYSNAQGEGFENRVVELLANALGDRVVYRWQPLRRGMIRKTLGAHACDVLAGVPVGMAGVATTVAYYRSGYVFVSKRGREVPIASLDDPRLEGESIGVELPGADMAGTPAALALARRGIVANVIGFPLYGSTPAAQRMIEALDRGDLDIAVVWGPQVGYFAARAKTPLAVTFIPALEGAATMTFDIALAVREEDAALRADLDRAIEERRHDIERVLASFDVPVLAPAVRPAP